MSVPGPVLGPCSAWISGADVAACCDAASNAALYDDVALEASMLMFELSGRIFPGLCTRTVRPCADPCSCGWGLGSGLSWYWGAWATAPGSSTWGWQNECGDRCGCGTLSRLKLAGYPVREIEQVKIDGAVVDPTEYRLEAWRWLTRLSDPGPPLARRFWPSCQDLSLEDSQPGTFSITYKWGVDPPPSGEKAAAQLACELYSACDGLDCELPAGAVRVIRQGIEIDRQLLLAFLDPTKPTGLVAVDAFLAAYGLRGRSRRSAVWSPDVRAYPRRSGA